MYEMPRHVIDLSLSYRIGKNLELSIGIRDIVSDPVVYKQFPEFIDYAGNLQKRSQITKEYKTGRNFSLSMKVGL